MSSLRNSEPAPEEVPGSQSSQNTKIASRNVADANSGTDVVSTETKEIDRSMKLPSAMPESTPSTSEMRTVRLKTHSASMPVFNRLGRMISITGRLNWIEVPKSPVSARPTQAIYRSRNGSLYPFCSSHACLCSPDV